MTDRDVIREARRRQYVVVEGDRCEVVNDGLVVVEECCPCDRADCPLEAFFTAHPAPPPLVLIGKPPRRAEVRS